MKCYACGKLVSRKLISGWIRLIQHRGTSLATVRHPTAGLSTLQARPATNAESLDIFPETALTLRPTELQPYPHQLRSLQQLQ